MKVILRKAKKEDFKEFSKLYGLFEKEYQKFAYESFARSSKNIKKDFENKLMHYFIVAQINDNVVGYFEGEFIKKYKRGYISDLFVLRKFRKQGIAKKMKNLFIKELKKRKYKDVCLDVNVKNPSTDIYKKWGFVITKYWMRKTLK